MDLILILVTLLSLTVAAMMSIVAWRAVRSERRRSEARVTALAADIHIRDDIQGRDTAPAGVATTPIPMPIGATAAESSTTTSIRRRVKAAAQREHALIR